MSTGETPGRRLRWGFARATAAALFGLAALAGLVAWAALRPPAWWASSGVQSTTGDRGAAFEQAIVAEFTRIRPAGADWAVRIRAADMNDWLASRLPQWLASRDLPESGQVQVHLRPGVIQVGVARGPAVIWTEVEPAAHGGGVRIQSATSGIGRLPLPIAGLDLSQTVPEGVERPIRLPDGRQVRIQDLEVLDGEIRLRLRTQGP